MWVGGIGLVGLGGRLKGEVAHAPLVVANGY
jgi:hypothetical protein